MTGCERGTHVSLEHPGDLIGGTGSIDDREPVSRPKMRKDILEFRELCADPGCDKVRPIIVPNPER